MMQQSVQQQPSSQSEFVSIPSKGRLWKILQDNGAFNDINNNFFTKVREDFEIGIVRIEEEHRNKSTLEKSKLFIDKMIQKMKEYKYAQSPISVKEPYTAQEIKKSKLDAFDNELSRKQEEFNKFNARPTPPQVDFADKDEDTSGDVNRLLEKAMRERENLEVPTPINSTPPINANTNNAIPTTSIVQEKDSKQVLDTDKSLEIEMLVNKLNKNEEILVKIISKLESIEEMLKKENKPKE